MGINTSTLVISDTKTDWQLFQSLLTPKGYAVQGIRTTGAIDALTGQERHAAIFIDYNQGQNQIFTCLNKLQENRSKACIILYGDQADPNNISKILQKGVYAFIERHLIPERIFDTLTGGLENRKAFIRILKMMDDLTDVNEQLNIEKQALKRKNQELNFINRLSSKTAYDLHWDEIMSRILDAGMLEVMELELFSMLYRIGESWYLTCYRPGKHLTPQRIADIKQQVADIFLTQCGKKISTEAMHSMPLSHASNNCTADSDTRLNPPEHILPLLSGGNLLGMVCLSPKPSPNSRDIDAELLSTLSNILAMSLNNAQKFNRLKERSSMDGLTGLYNHKRFKEILRNEVKRVCRYGKALSLVMIDGDKFKQINDTHGHLAGDMVLQELASCLKQSVRSTDIVARYGGDEFAILLPETDLEMAEILTRRIQRAVSEHTFAWKSQKIPVTISYGISMALPQDNKNDNISQACEQDLIHRADMNLYRMKQNR